MTARYPIILIVAAVVLLPACSGGKQHADLHRFMEEVKAKPAGEIEPLPNFPPYQAYKYQNIAKRSPFDPPRQVLADEISGRATVKPDESRRKEYLENFNFSSLSLVGTLERQGTLWALVNDGSGGIHRVTVGNHLGKNHGRVVSATSTKLDIVEIVPDGRGGWVERPRTLALREN